MVEVCWRDASTTTVGTPALPNVSQLKVGDSAHGIP